jgi:hypothetical protein
MEFSAILIFVGAAWNAESAAQVGADDRAGKKGHAFQFSLLDCEDPLGSKKQGLYRPHSKYVRFGTDWFRTEVHNVTRKRTMKNSYSWGAARPA